MAEEMLGARLFNWLPGEMQLTSAGELLLRGALDWRRDFVMIVKQIADLSGLCAGVICESRRSPRCPTAFFPGWWQ